MLGHADLACHNRLPHLSLGGSKGNMDETLQQRMVQMDFVVGSTSAAAAADAVRGALLVLALRQFGLSQLQAAIGCVPLVQQAVDRLRAEKSPSEVPASGHDRWLFDTSQD